MSKYRHLAALGSSFAAGPGIAPIVDSRAMRSGRNYAHVLAEALNAELTDLTVSGATTETIVDKEQRLLWRKFRPQLEGLPADADLVTITAGGNDLSYIGSMLRLAWANRLRARRWSRIIGDVVGRKGLPEIGPADVQGAASGLARVVESVRARAPQARILLVDYLTVMGDQTAFTSETPFGPVEVAAFRDLAKQLALAFGNAAATTGAELVRASKLSADHALGSADPWVLGLQPSPFGSTGASFHPNAAGMRAVAAEIHRLVVE